MWTYDKKLQYPINIKRPDPRMAQVIMTQLGGPDGELGASMRYLNQRYSSPYGKVTGILTDVGISVAKRRRRQSVYRYEESSPARMQLP